MTWKTVFSLLLVGILLIALGTATWQRNQLWRDPIAFWQDNARLSPNKARVFSSLGKTLLEQGRDHEAAQALQRALQLQPTGASSLDVVNLAVAYKRQRRFEEALAVTATALKQTREPFIRAKFLTNQGNIYVDLRRYAEAEQSYRRALIEYPPDLAAKINLANVLLQTDQWEPAESLYLEVLQRVPAHPMARQNLEILRQQRDKQGAAESFSVLP